MAFWIFIVAIFLIFFNYNFLSVLCFIIAGWVYFWENEPKD